MKVELIAVTHPFANNKVVAKTNPMSIVERCACVCYDSKPTEDYRIAKACMDSGHHSVLEHVNFTFHISEVSRALLAELSRHRHISLSVRSTRYCDESGFRWKTIYTNTTGTDELVSGAICEIEEIYTDLLKNKKASKDELRGMLPLALYTELYMTANARALIEMSHLRLCSRAHKEIRTMFEEIKKQVALVSPEIADYMRPKCEMNKYYPFCTERKGCGKHKPLKEVYNDGSKGC